MAAAVAGPSLGPAMEIQWTRMAGQWPVESSPLVGKFSGSGKEEILALNRGGQVMLWTPDGAAIGAGQDGTVTQLPEGRWTTAPTLLEPAAGARFVFASVEGLVVALNEKFEPAWRYKLPGETGWGRAVPALLRDSSATRLLFTDATGVVTCLTSDGKVAWTNALAAGACKVPVQVVSMKSGETLVLVPAGSTLVACDATGNVRWRRELNGEILTRPEILALTDRELVFCGTSTGSLFALNLKGEIAWQCTTGDTFSNWIVFLPRRGLEPLILFTGLWGNLHAVDVQGRRVWTHLFRTKTRAAPLVLEVDDDGRAEVLVPTFHQHVYAFDDEGQLKDDVRLSGIMPSALVPIAGVVESKPDLVVTTTTLLGYRLRPGLPKSVYGTTPEPSDIQLQFLREANEKEPPALLAKNPAGALVNIQLSTTDQQGCRRMTGKLTARTAVEIPIPHRLAKTGDSWHAVARNAAGRILKEQTWTLPGNPDRESVPPTKQLYAWGTPPFGAFDDARLSPVPRENSLVGTNGLAVESLYLDEADEAAFIIASTHEAPVRARIVLSRLARNDGTAFGGRVVLREVVATGSVNGKRVPDALPALGDAGLIAIAARRGAKIWLSVDARGAQPGHYTGHVAIASLDGGTNMLELSVKIEVLNLRLPTNPPLTLCTWDYVPNRWFPSRSREALDDMSRHGVNVFPRSTIPPGRADAAGKLTIDWNVLDAELDRLKGRGRILFHLNHPPIEFVAQRAAEEKRPVELEYIRAFRDHLRERGWSYEDYAFYLLDEPGLDYGTNIPVLLDAGQLIREADPKLLTYTDPVPGLSWKDYERIEPLVDVWAPNMRLVSGLLSGDPRIQRILKQKTVWSYECVSQVKSLSPLRYNRANAWRAKFFGLSGIGFWTHSTTEVDHWLPGKTINDEYALVYPGELPVPSVRWEAVRDGLEDVAAMALLEEQIRRHWDAGTQNDRVQEAEAALRLALRDAMEISDEAFVESRDFLRDGDRMLGHTWTDMETFRRHRATIAQLTLALRAE
jgi:hypothetical protein